MKKTIKPSKYLIDNKLYVKVITIRYLLRPSNNEEDDFIYNIADFG